jgi:hypothetical protein
MKTGVPWFVGLAAVFVAAGLTVSPALATCGKDCKTLIKTEFKACKTACPKGSAGKACKACSDEKKADVATCKTATNPTPPSCGETTTTTTTTSTTTPSTFHWVLTGSIGDCSGLDRAPLTPTDVPDPSQCTQATQGTAAVCWDGVNYSNACCPGQAECTYKSVAPADCTGGSNPGYMYVCQP